MMPDPSPASSFSPVLEIEVVAPQWQNLIDTIQEDIQTAIQMVIDDIVQYKVQFEISLVFTNDAEIQDLNRDYRSKDAATNVLSFPQIEKFSDIENMPTPVMLGDVILAWETVAKEAELQDKPLAHHVLHLIVHGVMHLLGFDHISDIEADEMEKIEIDILSRLHIPNPYL